MRLQNYLIEQEKFTIYFDMDGVLADFVTSFKKIDGRTTQEVEKEGDPAFWAHVKKGGLAFWTEMPWMKGSKKLWNNVYGNRKTHDYNVEILTAAARKLPDSPKGKKIWVNRELGAVKINLIRARDKHQFASKHSLLIDDSEKTIQQWRGAGGIGIHFKSPGQVLKDWKKAGQIHQFLFI